MATEKLHIPSNQKNNDRARLHSILNVHVNTFLYSTCFWIQSGALPYFTRELGGDVVMFGLLKSTMSMFQLIGGPIFGRFGDIYGGKFALMLAYAASAVAYILTASSYNLPLLFLSHVPVVFQHAMQAGQMVVTKLYEGPERANALGKLGISYGFGMVVGPVLGGILSENFGLRFSVVVATFISALSILIAHRYLPTEDRTHQPQFQSSKAEKAKSVFNLKEFFRLLRIPGVRKLLFIKCIAAIPLGIFHSTLSMVAITAFGMSPQMSGIFTSYVGVIAMLTQAIAIKPIVRHYKERGALLLGTAGLCLSFVGLTFSSHSYGLIAILIPLTISGVVMTTVISSAITNEVPENDTGAALGMNMAVNSAVRIVSPTMGAFVVSYFGFNIGVGMTGALLNGIMCLAVYHDSNARYYSHNLKNL